MEQNNEKHDFEVDMSVNFKSTTVFVCTGKIRIKYTRKPYFIRKIYRGLRVRNLRRFCGYISCKQSRFFTYIRLKYFARWLMTMAYRSIRTRLTLYAVETLTSVTTRAKDFIFRSPSYLTNQMM